MLGLWRVVVRTCIAAAALACNGVVGAGCATARSVIEIPDCADRFEVTGQAERTGPKRLELDHTFDVMFSRTQLSFQADGDVETFVVESNQPDPLRMFFGIGAAFGGALLLGSAGVDVAGGAGALEPAPLAAAVGGAALLTLGTGTAITGWHPARGYVTFPDACREASSRAPIER